MLISFVLYPCFAVIVLLVAVDADRSAPKRKLRILVNNPLLGFSHQSFHGKLADLLHEAGHEVDVFAPTWIPFEERTGVEKARVIKFHATTYTRYHELDILQNPFKNTAIMLDVQRGMPYVNASLQFCYDLVNHPSLLNDMRESNYDLVIGETLDRCIFYAAELLKIPKRVITSAIGLPDEIAFALGIPVPRSYVPSIFACSPDVPILGVQERLSNIVIDYVHGGLFVVFNYKLREIFESKFDVKLPTFPEIIRSASYVFVNAHAHLDHPRPITNKVQYIGGIAVAKPKPQHTPSISAIFDRSLKGVIYFSLGSLVDAQLMPSTLKEAFVNAFARFPQYSVIWRFVTTSNDSTLFSRAPNVFPVNWADQTTLLNDPRTRLFISHCGLNSAMETAMSGVPVLGVPLFADQSCNAALFVRRGMGLVQDMQSVDEEELVGKIGRLLNEPSFKQKAKEVSRKLQDEPFKPDVRFVRLIEYAAAHENNDDLELYGTQLGFVRANNLDVYSLLIGGFLAFFYFSFKLTQFLSRIAGCLVREKQKAA